MKLRTLIIDDEPIALEKLGKYVGKIPFLELVGACESALDASAFLADNQVDLIFTDINMPDLSGMDFIASLPTAPMVVFITAYAQYAVDSYRLSAVDYLLKPYGFAEFQRASAIRCRTAVAERFIVCQSRLPLCARVAHNGALYKGLRRISSDLHHRIICAAADS